jgi:hypothetical protein
MLLPLPKRNPEEPLNARHLRTSAESALELVRTIRDYLPVEGETQAKCNSLTADQWFSHAGDAYTRFERIRNPTEMPWPGPRGSFWGEAPEGASEQYIELCYTMEPLCGYYAWQGISDGSRRTHSDVRGGGSIPAVPERILAAIEKPATRLLELTQWAVAWGYDSDLMTDKRDHDARVHVIDESGLEQLAPNHPLDEILSKVARTPLARLSWWWEQKFPAKPCTRLAMQSYLCAVHNFEAHEADALTWDEIAEILRQDFENSEQDAPERREEPDFGVRAKTRDHKRHPDSEPFVPTPFQKAILSALDGVALRTDALAGKVGDRRRLFKPGGIKELMALGLVKNHRRLGYYRPDARPTELGPSAPRGHLDGTG